jgi:hypothetical protein
MRDIAGSFAATVPDYLLKKKQNWARPLLAHFAGVRFSMRALEDLAGSWKHARAEIVKPGSS